MLTRTISTLCLIVFGIAIGLWWSHAFTGRQLHADTSPVGRQSPIVPWPDQSAEEMININVYDVCNKGVVNISTKSIRQTSFFTESAVEGAGSGSIIDRGGHILTNNHVIDNARDINVTLYTGDSYPAVLVGHDADNDVAVLRISAPDDLLFPIEIGESSSLRVGQHIIAIGNPFGLERTMSTGIISSLNRRITSKTRRSMKSIIQIDAALNQGNSGGPLLNSRGALIGMNTAIATSTGDNAGIGFAIPANTISRVVQQLIANGRVSRPTIGIVEAIETEKGLLVRLVTPGGPAEQAGIRGMKVTRRKIRRGPMVFEQDSIDQKSADLIVAVDDAAVKSADDLLSVIESKQAGEIVRLSVSRDGRILVVPVTLGKDE